jgi:Ca2+-binding RTX toxin-like protein
VQEVSSKFGTVATLGDDEVLSGTLDYQNDIDMYRINLTAGEVYTFALTGDGVETSMPRAYLRLFDSTGTAVTDQLLNFSSALETVFTATQSGTHFVRVGSTSSSAREGGFLLLACNTTVEGDALANTLRGSAQNERISGFDGNDWLVGGAGDDTLFCDKAAAAYYDGFGTVPGQVY